MLVFSFQFSGGDLGYGGFEDGLDAECGGGIGGAGRGAFDPADGFRDLPGDQFEFYGNYYNAQATFQIGGRYWSEYAAWMYDTYLGKQDEDGSWDSREAGRIYGTAMMTLAFTVPYRQLPIYQRDEPVDEAD